MPFDTYKPKDVKKTIDEFIPKGVKLVREKIDRIDKDTNTVLLENGSDRANRTTMNVTVNGYIIPKGIKQIN